jgi:hypothetical protein
MAHHAPAPADRTLSTANCSSRASIPARSNFPRWPPASCMCSWTFWETQTTLQLWMSYLLSGGYSNIRLDPGSLLQLTNPTPRSEVVEKFPKLRAEITHKLISTFSDIKSGKVFRGALWIVGEYCEGAEGEEPQLGLRCQRSTLTSLLRSHSRCPSRDPQGHRRGPHPCSRTTSSGRSRGRRAANREAAGSTQGCYDHPRSCRRDLCHGDRLHEQRCPGSSGAGQGRGQATSSCTSAEWRLLHRVGTRDYPHQARPALFGDRVRCSACQCNEGGGGLILIIRDAECCS